jgi:hypothetical protein
MNIQFPFTGLKMLFANQERETYAPVGGQTFLKQNIPLTTIMWRTEFSHLNYLLNIASIIRVEFGRNMSLRLYRTTIQMVTI